MSFKKDVNSPGIPSIVKTGKNKQTETETFSQKMQTVENSKSPKKRRKSKRVSAPDTIACSEQQQLRNIQINPKGRISMTINRKISNIIIVRRASINHTGLHPMMTVDSTKGNAS